MKNCVIVSAVRTAIGSFNGSLASTSAIDLGATVIKAAIERAKIDSQHVDEVIMGNVLQAGLGQNPARQALLKSGLAETVCGFTVNKVCGSGLKSVALAAQAIQAGQAQSIVAGGMENMSLAPYLLDAKARSGYRLGDGQVYDVILRDGLMCATHGYHMGITAENVAKEYGITREMQDELALHSQRKAAAAIESGAFTAEIVPVNVVTRKKTFVFSQDEFPKANSTAEALGALRPAFDKAGTVTAGNAGAHLVPEGGLHSMPVQYAGNGWLLVGDALRSCVNTGISVRGMDMALTGAQAAAQTLISACQHREPQNLFPLYHHNVERSLLWDVLQRYQHVPALLQRPGWYRTWPALMQDISRDLWDQGDKPVPPLRQLFWHHLRRHGLWHLAGDVIRSLRCL